MSEYRTHLRESVEALRDAAQRVAEALDETAGLGKSTEADKGEAEERVAAPVTVDATPAPSSPLSGSAPLSDTGNSGDVGKSYGRRWWVNVYPIELSGDWAYETRRSADFNSGDARTECVEVVPAAALDAQIDDVRQRLHEALGRNASTAPFTVKTVCGEIRSLRHLRDYWQEQFKRISDGKSREIDDLRAKLAEATRDVLRVAGERDDALYRQERDAARAQLAKARTVTREQVEAFVREWDSIIGYTTREKARICLRAAGLEVENG